MKFTYFKSSCGWFWAYWACEYFWVSISNFNEVWVSSLTTIYLVSHTTSSLSLYSISGSEMARIFVATKKVKGISAGIYLPSFIYLYCTSSWLNLLISFFLLEPSKKRSNELSNLIRYSRIGIVYTIYGCCPKVELYDKKGNNWE